MKDPDPMDFDEIAQVDLYEHPETGAELVSANTKDGEEYVITNKRMVKKLIEYVEDDIDIHFKGTVTEDPYNHIKVLTVKSFEPTQEIYVLPPIDDPPATPSRGRGGKKAASDDDLGDIDLGDDDLGDIDLEDIDLADVDLADDVAGDDDLTDDALKDILDDSDYEDLDASMFDEDMMNEDISEDEKQRLQAELDKVVSKSPKK